MISDKVLVGSSHTRLPVKSAAYTLPHRGPMIQVVAFLLANISRTTSTSAMLNPSTTKMVIRLEAIPHKLVNHLARRFALDALDDFAGKGVDQHLPRRVRTDAA